jgi:hypothetical protein
MKLRLYIFIIASLFCCCGGFAKTKIIEGSSIFYIPSTMTRAQAEDEAIRRAKIDALSKAFGNSIIASNTSIISENDERFYSNGFDLVKGEWIETIGIPEIKTRLDGDEIFLVVKIKGKAREKKMADIDISATILRNGTTINCESSEFKSGDKMYVQFVTPIDGYISIYQHDPTTDMVYCLLPYKKDGSGCIRVLHDKEYIFFSKSNSSNPRIVDEYRLGCSADGEVNTIFIVFSTNMFTKSATNSSDRYTPRNLRYTDFESWKSKCQAQDAMMQVISKNIIINK